MIEWILYLLARSVIWIFSVLPLIWVARLGRGFGTLFYWLDKRHRTVTRQNLEMCFGKEMSNAQIRSLTREVFRRIGENFCCAAKTAFISEVQIRKHLTFAGLEPLLGPNQKADPQDRVVVAIGHFGNFELYAQFMRMFPGYRTATTYRSVRQASINRLMLNLRERSGCEFFERRTEASKLKQFMQGQGIILGLLADQHAGDRGLPVPLFGLECSTSAAPGVFALRYGCRLFTAYCFRTGLARWQIELGREIPTHGAAGQPRAVEEIATDMNRDFETAIRRDPANWFWVHKRWKPRKNRATSQVRFSKPTGEPGADPVEPEGPE